MERVLREERPGSPRSPAYPASAAALDMPPERTIGSRSGQHGGRSEALTITAALGRLRITALALAAALAIGGACVLLVQELAGAPTVPVSSSEAAISALAGKGVFAPF